MREKQPTDEHFDEVRRAVEVSAASYARRIWWVDRKEMEQQGWVYACEIMNRQRTFDPSVGVPLFGYLSKAVSRLLYVYVCMESSPASASRRHAAALKGLHRAPESDIPEGTSDLEQDIYELFTDGARRSKLESVLIAAVGAETAEMAIPYLIGEEKGYKAAAARAGRTPAEVRDAVKRVRKVIINSPEMWRLWA